MWDDSLALVNLYDSTGGPEWYNHTNWLTKNPVSTWYGITVKNWKVCDVYLGFNSLKGKIPESIGNFDSIITLLLDYNSLSGQIPIFYWKFNLHAGL